MGVVARDLLNLRLASAAEGRQEDGACAEEAGVLVVAPERRENHLSLKRQKSFQRSELCCTVLLFETEFKSSL